MTLHTFQYAQKRSPARSPMVSMPSSLVEYGFYFYLVYFFLAGALGVWVNNVSSVLLLLLVIFCLWEVGFHQMVPVTQAVTFPLGCAVAFVFIQLVIYEESLTVVIRPFLLWMLLLILIQALTLRENFLHRFALVVFLIGLAALPYLSSRQSLTEGGEVARASLNNSAIGFSQINEMGEWYGFCALYFVVLAFTTKINVLRMLALPIAMGCLYLVMLTVSRGALMGVALGTVVAGRHLLKKGFLPALLIACIGLGAVALGVFDQSMKSYEARGTEDTGRLTVWPYIIDGFLESPLIGVGHSNVGASPKGHLINPHNGFLYLAQSSGIVPLALFVAYWIRSGRAALKADRGKSPDSAFFIPLLIYTFITVNLSGLTFMKEWAIVSLAISMTASVQRQGVHLSGKWTGSGYVRRGESFSRPDPSACTGGPL